jgi:hypothetical protein
MGVYLTNRDNVVSKDRSPVGAGAVVGPKADGSGPTGDASLENLANADDLKAIEALTGTGLPARTASNTWVLRSLAVIGAGLSVTNPAGTAGNPSFALANDVAALEALTGTGFAKRTGTDAWTLVAGAEPSDGDKGDITVTSSGTVWTIDALAVTNAKINDLAWTKLTGTPTTLTGYGITDAQPLDSDLTAIAALTTTTFGRSLLTQADASAARATLGAGTSNFNGAFTSLTSVPTTLLGYGITDAQPLDGDLTALAAVTGTNTIYYRSASNTWSAVTMGSGITFTGGALSAAGGSGSGDVTGPAGSSVDGAPALYSGTTGKILKNGSGVTLVNGTMQSYTGIGDLVFKPELTTNYINFQSLVAIRFGTTSLTSPAFGMVQVYGTDDNSTYYSCVRASADAFSGGFNAFKAHGSLAVPTATQGGDDLYAFTCGGHSGAAWVSSKVAMKFQASQTWTGSAQGTQILIAVTPNNSTTRADAFTFQNDKFLNAVGGYYTPGKYAFDTGYLDYLYSPAAGDVSFVSRGIQRHYCDSNGNDSAGTVEFEVHCGEAAGGTSNVRFGITLEGSVLIGKAALATTATDGFLYISTCAGVPTGVPRAFTGRSALHYDTTNNKLYVYNGAWKSVALL